MRQNLPEPARRGTRTALITGASAGLGAEFARQCAARGYNLVLVARRTDRLQALADTLMHAHAIAADVVAANLADVDAPERIAAQLHTRDIHVDYLINNAGAAGPDLLTERDWQPHARYLQLMQLSVTHLCQLFAPAMQQRGFGRIINVASVAGRIPRPNDLVYGPSKAYLVAFSEALALTLAADGVHVCALCPGFTHTEFHDGPDQRELKARSPRFIWYAAETVVREGLAAVERGDRVFVSGRLYRWLDPFLQSPLTRGLAVRIASKRF